MPSARLPTTSNEVCADADCVIANTNKTNVLAAVMSCRMGRDYQEPSFTSRRMCSGRYNAALPNAAKSLRGDRRMSGATVTDPSTPTTPPLPGLLSRAIGIITAPGATYEHIVRTPKVAGILFLVALVTALAAGLPQFTERGQAAMLDMLSQQGQSDAQLEAVQKLASSGLLGYVAMVNMMVFIPLSSVIIAGLLWVVFNTVMGGTATFKHSLAVVAHSQVISALGALFAAPIIYARGTMSRSVANLSALLPMLDETSFLSKVLGMVDFFLVWWVVVLSIGLATLYKKKTGSVATGLFIFYGIVVLAIAYFTAGNS
jgi:hypothetical protein